jgi:hypothetical protein
MVALGNEAETIYMVSSGLPQYVSHQCCFDFGNAEANNLDTGEGSMECVYVGTFNATGKGWCGGAGDTTILSCCADALLPFFSTPAVLPLLNGSQPHLVNGSRVRIEGFHSRPDMNGRMGVISGKQFTWRPVKCLLMFFC